MIIMIKCDILVVGSSASGSTASLMLSKKGYKVLTIDKDKEIGDSTGKKIDITESILHDDTKLEPILKEIDVKPLKKFNVSKWSSENEEFILKQDVYDYFFKRGPAKDSIENQIINKAINNGCELLLNSTIEKIKFKNNKIHLVKIKEGGKNLTIKPKIIVGADGSYSVCRKISNIKEISTNILEGMGIILNDNSIFDTEVIFDSKFAPGGYIYSGSEENQSFVAVMTDKQKMYQPIMEIFNYNREKNILFKNVRKKNISNYFRGSEKYGILERITSNNILLVGGAGLLINPFLGFGLNYAIVSGYKSAEHINNYLSLNKSLDDYNQYYYKNILPYFKNALKARKIFNKLDNRDMDFIIRCLGKFSEKNIRGINALTQILKSKPTSLNALKILHIFSKILL